MTTEEHIDAVKAGIERLGRRLDAAEFVIATLITNLKTGNVSPEQAVEWFEREGRTALETKEGRG